MRLRTLVARCLRDVTDGSRLDDVGHLEALDRLVLADAATAVRAAHEAGVSAPVLVAAAIPPLLGLESRA